MNSQILPVELAKAYRLINHGPTVLVSAQAGDGLDVMAAAWACALDYAPPKLTVVLDKSSTTRLLVEQSGRFVVQVPTVAQADLTYRVGSLSLSTQPDKLALCGVDTFAIEGVDTPLVTGCAAWLACELIPELHIQQTYDLFIGQVTGAWADSRVFRDGHWHFDEADPALRSLHYIAGGQFYAIGEGLKARGIGRA